MSKNRAGKPPSQRQLRVGEQLRCAVSDMLFRDNLYDAELSNVTITVTEASISPDLRNAIIYIVPMGEGDADTIVKALNRNAHHFKHYIAKNIDLRYHPNITFKFDNSFDYAAEISCLLNKAKQRDGQE